MTSTPEATTTSYAPAITPWAAKCAACCEDPHWRSTVVPGTLSGHPAAKTALRAIFVDCSPACITQPMTTSSIIPGSMPVRSIKAFIVSATKSTGCQSFNFPFRRPRGVRIASTITALNIMAPDIKVSLQSAVLVSPITNLEQLRSTKKPQAATRCREHQTKQKQQCQSDRPVWMRADSESLTLGPRHD